MNKQQIYILKMVNKYFFLFLGSVVAAIGLEIFLVPNNIIDGGIVRISIISSYLCKLPIGVFTFVLNIPFLFIGYKQIGKTFVISSLFSVTVFSVSTILLHPIPGLTNDVLLASVFGGIILGSGVGLILRYGGSLDGTEIVAIIITKNSLLSIGQLVMIFNIIIFSAAAIFLGWDRALYSMLSYFIAHKAIDIVVEGFDEVKAVTIICYNGEQISDAITARLGRVVTFVDGRGGFSKEKKTILYSVVTRLEISKLTGIIYETDKNAFVTINDVADVMGGTNKKRSIH